MVEFLQVASLVGAVAVLIGLFRAHKYVVRTQVVPNIEDEGDGED
jgi:hypothetical protein